MGADATSADQPDADRRQTHRPDADRPDADRRGAIEGEALLLAVSLAVIVASMLLSASSEAVSAGGFSIPPLCLFKNVTGWDCFGCGLTRSFVYMGHGEIVAAFERHMLGPPLYLAVLLQIPWRVRALLRLRSGG